MSKLVLIDGNNILHRAYYALPSNLTTRSGEPINAIYGFVSMLLRIITDLKPTHIAIAFDREEPTFRKKEYKKYQVQRKPTEPELKSQFAKARDVTAAFNIPVYELSGYEADDLIGTIAQEAVKIKKSKSKIDEVIVVTGDQDMLQLVDDSRNIKLYMPIAGLSSTKLFEEKDTIEKLGVKPSQIIDYKSLVGDPSDNYPGVFGIGPKTAVNLLSEHKSKEGIYKNISNISKPVREKLEKDRKNADISYRLATIVKDSPVDIDLDKMKNWQVDSQSVLNLFAEYGFRTLTRRVKDVGRQIVSENQKSLF